MSHLLTPIHNPHILTAVPNFNDPIWGLDPMTQSSDLIVLKKKLYSAPASSKELSREIAYLRRFIPKHLHSHPLIPLAANGLHIVIRLMGTSEEDITHYGGMLETEVPGGFHNLYHSGNGARLIVQHVSLANAECQARGANLRYSDEAMLTAMTAYCYHDAFLGNNRYTVNPHFYDERMSALLFGHLGRVYQYAHPDVTDDIIKGAMAGIEATRFNNKLMRQNVNLDQDNPFREIEIATAGADLVSLALPAGPWQAMGLLVEDLCIENNNYGNVLGQLAKELHCKIATVTYGLSLIDAYGSRTYTVGNITKNLTEWALLHMSTVSGFMRTHEYPNGWMLDDKTQRHANAAFIGKLIVRLRNKDITFVEAHRLAKAYARTSYAKQPLTATW